ncbi:hypothetical protein [Dyella sp. Tek66A03]|uniref:hypothetical protein n=1 Tax=Dyella sp. Tek66A03 TaxID=3458298 RepID=UPI00403EA174
MVEQSILIHYHIFKNAGSSVDACLQRSFGSLWGTFEGEHAHDVQSSGQLATFIQANPGLKAVSSHLARPPLPHRGCLPVTFVRHPLLRAYSVYRFSQKDETQPFAEVARDRNFAAYIEWALRGDPGSIVIRNYQVVHLSDASWRGGDILQACATEADLGQAQNLLREWGIVGVVELFDLSVQVLQETYAPLLPGLRLSSCWENSTARNILPWEHKVFELRNLIGDELYAAFMQANRLDMALHTCAREILLSSAGRSRNQTRARPGLRGFEMATP